MSTPIEPSQEQNAYYTDPENAAEMARLTKQARLLTKAMEGPLAGLTHVEQLHDILDLACGPGAWVIETATTYPEKQVTGVDISRLMIDYARFDAAQHGVSNAHFQVMNILHPLDFADSSFDLVNVRLIASFMFGIIDSWSALVQECLRVTRPGGTIRLTDCEWFLSNSPTVEKFFALCLRAIHLMGNTFSPDGRTLATTPMLGRLLRNAECRNVQHHAFAIDCSFGSESYQSFYEDVVVFLKLLLPLLVKAGVAAQDEAEMLYHRTLEEMREKDFNCIWYYLSVWGEHP